MIAWAVALVGAVDWWLWIALAACTALAVALWIFPGLDPLVRILGTVAIVVSVVIGLLLHAWQAESGRADEAEALLAGERALRATAERQLRAEQTAAMERLADDRAIDALNKDMTDAIDKAAERAPGVAPGAATVALGCARLRAAGSTASEEYQRICG